MNFQWSESLLTAIKDEVDRGNLKHGHGELATTIQVIAILAEELGEFSSATMQNKPAQARHELIQVVAVAVNYLNGTGPHFSSLK